MANEFRIKHGLIVTGSSYFSESMFAPNLPEETAPNYYITWRQSDGRFEVSEVSPTTVATTVGCWDYIGNGDPGTGEWSTDPINTIGGSTNTIMINVTDNGGNNQNTLLSSIGNGSLITLYVGAGLVTTFEIVGTPQVIYGGSPIAIFRYDFVVSYVSGDQYSITGTPEMCLEVSATSPSNQNCLNFTADNNFNIDSVAGDSAFLIDNGSSVFASNTISNDIVALLLNSTDNNGKPTKNFFQQLTPGAFFTVNYKNNKYDLEFVSLGSGFGGSQVSVLPYSSQPSFTIPLGNSYDICISPGL